MIGGGGGGLLEIETKLRRLVGIERNLRTFMSGIERSLERLDQGSARAKGGCLMPTNFTNRLWSG